MTLVLFTVSRRRNSVLQGEQSASPPLPISEVHDVAVSNRVDITALI